MEKRSYYITISTGMGEIREVKGGSTYDFEIVATPEEAKVIEDLFLQASESDGYSFLHSHLPYTYKYEHDNEMYDHALDEVYRMIYQLGTPKTREEMEKIGLHHLIKRDPVSPDSLQTEPETNRLL